MMPHRSVGRGGGAGDTVDTSKFESWPLLRPDELANLPTEVLRASVEDLDAICRQAPGKEEGYVVRQSAFATGLVLVGATTYKV